MLPIYDQPPVKTAVAEFDNINQFLLFVHPLKIKKTKIAHIIRAGVRKLKKKEKEKNLESAATFSFLLTVSYARDMDDRKTLYFNMISLSGDSHH